MFTQRIVMIKKDGNNLKESNKNKILNCIRTKGPISRVDIVKEVSVSKSTVTRIVEELIIDSIVEEAGKEPPTSGRRPVYLKIKDGAYVCIGVNISPKKIHISAVDLGGDVLIVNNFDVIRQDTLDGWRTFVEELKKSIEITLTEGNIKPKNILGIGMGIPIVIEDNETVLFDSRQQEYLKKSIEDGLNLPMFIDKNPTTRMLGELWYGFGRGSKNILYVVLGEGIGLGVLSNGEVIRGSDNLAGELGHTIAMYEGRNCVCGKKGCLEAYSSINSIEKIYKEKTNKSKVFEEISKLSLDGDIQARAIINKSINLIAIKISDLIHLYNPEAVIFTGEFLESDKKIFWELQDQIQKNTLTNYLENLKFYHREVNTELYSIGAAALVYKKFFD